MRYLNPGYKNWLTIGASSRISEVTDAKKTKTGIGFINSWGDSNHIQLDARGEIYCKFDFYYMQDSSFQLQVGEFADGSYVYNGFSYNSSNSQQTARIAGVANYVEKPVANWSDMFKRGKVNSALFHLKYTDSEKGFMTLQFNDSVITSGETENLLPRSSKIRFSFSGTDAISNIIISDDPISIKEQIVSVPAGEIFTEMDFSDGLYTADSAGQTFLQSVNLNSLINEFGAASKVTGVAVVGNPAFRTGEGLSTITAISQKGGVISEHSAANVPADSSVVQATFSLSDTTLADLQNIQLGLKVGG